ELDGGRHGFPEQQADDAARDTELERKGIKVLRFWNSRLRREKEFVRDEIWRTLRERAPQPLPDYCRPLMTPEAVRKQPGETGCEASADCSSNVLFPLTPTRSEEHTSEL